MLALQKNAVARAPRPPRVPLTPALRAALDTVASSVSDEIEILLARLNEAGAPEIPVLLAMVNASLRLLLQAGVSPDLARQMAHESLALLAQPGGAPRGPRRVS